MATVREALSTQIFGLTAATVTAATAVLSAACNIDRFTSKTTPTLGHAKQELRQHCAAARSTARLSRPTALKLRGALGFTVRVRRHPMMTFRIIY